MVRVDVREDEQFQFLARIGDLLEPRLQQGVGRSSPPIHEQMPEAAVLVVGSIGNEQAVAIARRKHGEPKNGHVSFADTEGR